MTATAPQDLHRLIVEAAMHAPSVHNTQPWRFSSYEDGLDLWADETRRLPVLDPYGRQLHLSCGGALLHARVAARARGLDADAQLLPTPDDPTHLARLRLTPGSSPSAAEQSLAEAILRRHTYREAFGVSPVPARLLEQLRLAAEQQGARLHSLTDPDDVLELEVLLSRADSVEEADPAYRAELATWIHDGPAEDGIPREGLPVDPERGSSLRLRDFELTGPGPGGGEPPVAEHPTVVVVLTDDDTPLSWLQAGQALGAVLLRAAQGGVLAQPLGQVTDTLEYRLRLRHALGVLGIPQLALRMGYATTASASTPRRSIDDVLTGQPGTPTAADSTDAAHTGSGEGHVAEAPAGVTGGDACVMGQPRVPATDLPAARERLRTALGLVGTPQMAPRLGYATATAPTPRRDVDDVLSQAALGGRDAEAAGALRVWESESGHLRAPDGWTLAVPLADLPDGTALGVVLAGRPVCLARSAGQVHALLDECSHGQVLLSEGDVDGGFVECWLHGSLFDLTTGRPTGPPATVPVPVYPVRVVAGFVEVAMPAPTDCGDTR